jgi:hypothetical protein
MVIEGHVVYSGQPTNTSWVTRTDPAGKNHVEMLDNLSRTIREIRNLQDGSPSTTISDYIDYQNNVTGAVEYDDAGRVSKRIAFDYAAGLSVVQQVTAYVYVFYPGTFVRLAGRKHAMEMIEKFCRVENLCPRLRPDG